MPKSFPKILTILFLLTFIIQLGCLIVLLALPLTGQAAVDRVNLELQVKGLNYQFQSSDTSTGNIARYISAIYQYAIGIVGILAAVVLMFGGVLWIVAGGNATQISEAKAWIGAALTGIVLALTSYLILNTVNPALVNLQTSKIEQVTESKIYSCRKVVNGKQTCTDDATEQTCTDGTLSVSGCSCCSYEKMTSVIATIMSSNWLCEEGLNQTTCASRTTGDFNYQPNAYCEYRSSVLSLCVPR